MNLSRIALTTLLAALLVTWGCDQTLPPDDDTLPDDDDTGEDDDDSQTDDDDADDDDVVDDDDTEPQPDCTSVASLSCPSNDTISRSNDAVGSTNAIDAWGGCPAAAGLTGPEIAFSFVPSASGAMTATLTGLEADVDLLLLEDTCEPASCSDYSYNSGSSDEEITFAFDAGTTYFFVVDGYDGGISDFVLTLGCGGGDDDDATPDDDDTTPADDDDTTPADDDDDSTPAVPNLPGDIVITEIIQNPTGTDTGKEWFEILNTTARAIDLAGWTIQDQGSDSHVIAGAVVVPAGAYLVLGESTDTTTNGGAPVDYAYAGVTMGNGDDELELVDAAAVLIDTVSWDDGATFPDPNGASMNLDPGSLNATANGTGANWCTSTAPTYGTNGDLGTPGDPNVTCAAGPVDADGDGSDSTLDCNDADAAIHPGAVDVACDGIDQDCSGADTVTDVDGDGSVCADDCDDTDAAVNPSAVENTTNGVDDDCDGQVDEGAVACPQNESEPNNGWTNDDPIVTDLAVCGVVNPAADYDTFGFTVLDWTAVEIDVDAEVDGSALDSYLYLLDDGGSSILENDDSGGLDSLIEVILVDAGTYYVEIEDAWGLGGATYTYEVIVNTDAPCDVIEIEPNGSSTYADVVLQGETACGTVDDAWDADYFEVYVAAGTTLTFDVNAWDLGSPLGAQIVLYDTDGSTELDRDEPGGFGDPTLTWTFTTTGTYYVDVESDSIVWNVSGPYQLVVE